MRYEFISPKYRLKLSSLLRKMDAYRAESKTAMRKMDWSAYDQALMKMRETTAEICRLVEHEERGSDE